MPSLEATATPPVVLDELRARVQQLQGRPSAQAVATHPVLSGLIQLQTGGVYHAGSAGALSLLLAGPSAEGAWCAVVGMPDLGTDSLVTAGVNLDRLIVVPAPREAWLEVTAALIDVVSVVAVQPPDRSVKAHEANRLVARLRHRGAVLFTTGNWPRVDAQVRLQNSQWVGAGRGYGHLQARRVTLEVQRKSLPPRQRAIWFPDVNQHIRPDVEAEMSSAGQQLRSVG